MPSTIVRSACPYDCPDTCGILATIENGQVIAVSGDPDHPYSKGTLCAKMNNYERTVHSPDRLTTPLVRSGPKGSGQFRPISWDEAIAMIAEKWRGIIAAHGAEAILPYSYAGTMGIIQRNSGHSFFHRLGASRLDRTICSPAKDEGWRAVMGNTPAVDPDSITESDLVILWGIDAAATSVHFLHRAAQAKKRGAKLLVIDTYLTRTAAAADHAFLVRPGSDGALALGIMHILDRDNRIDRDFIKDNVQGFPELASHILPEYSPDKVSALTGISVREIEQLAATYGQANAPLIRLGSGLSRYGNGAMTIRTIACLPALTGAYAKPGGGCFGGTATSGAFAMNEITREDFMARPTRIVNMNRLGEALNNLSDPPVMSLYVYHSNPAAITPDQNSVIKGLSREELFTVVHERFLTDTARYADLVLPATSSMEHSDIYRSYGSYCIQRAIAAIPPVGASKSNWEVFALLAGELGFEQSFFRQSTDELIDKVMSGDSPWTNNIETGIINSGKGVRLTVPSDPSRPYLTPSGKIELLNPTLANPLPHYLPPHAAEDPGQFWLMTAPAFYGLNSSFFEREELRSKQGGMRIIINPQDAADLGISDGSVVTAWNSYGEVDFILGLSEKVPSSIAVTEGAWWIAHSPGRRTVNALTSQRLTDMGRGSTFYDNRVDIRGKT
ncbi:molybdopterin oxidoreductase family protein [Geobacter pelophilus]|uniref:Molybdopterin oxidoreductase family protein n=1 Tax=Geoanaerobacter pelophilus TaxID=60036 RepID=A0AAW4L8G5_9BACT|nr:molybdopterin oxidoreductase family protein [Geoanaerobacter pelophilus]MBT0663491.1 molybdopterin oxidoreductase family protein [Geoanaerobacter pelophilus]